MVGIKGRSGGKAITAEAKALKSMAAKSRDDKRAKTTAIKGRLGDPVTYGDLLKSVQVDGELLQNDRRAIEVQRAEVELSKAQDERALARGDLLTREQHREAVAAVVAAIIEASSTLTASAVSMHPPEQQPMARHQFESALAEWRAASMALIKDASK